MSCVLHALGAQVQHAHGNTKRGLALAMLRRLLLGSCIGLALCAAFSGRGLAVHTQRMHGR